MPMAINPSYAKISIAVHIIILVLHWGWRNEGESEMAAGPMLLNADEWFADVK